MPNKEARALKKLDAAIKAVEKEKPTNMKQLVDDFGRIKAELAELAKKEKSIRDEIAALGEGAYEGELFRVTVSESIRETLDMDAVREKLSPQFIRAHTRETPVTTVRAMARTGEAA